MAGAGSVGDPQEAGDARLGLGGAIGGLCEPGPR